MKLQTEIIAHHELKSLERKREKLVVKSVSMLCITEICSHGVTSLSKRSDVPIY